MGNGCLQTHNNSTIKVKKEVDLSSLINDNKSKITMKTNNKRERKIEIIYNTDNDKKLKVEDTENIKKNTKESTRNLKNIKISNNSNEDKIKEQINDQIDADSKLNKNMKDKNKSAESLFHYNLNRNQSENKFESINISNSASYKIDDFSKEIFDQINLSRTNCLEYARKIDYFYKRIFFDENENKKYLIPSNGKKIFLPKKEDGFLECSNFFKNLQKNYLENQSFPRKLRFVEELKFPLIKNDVDNSLKKDYISKTYNNMKKILNGIYDIYNMIYYKSLEDPEISTLLQIIDQENDHRVRYCLLYDKLKYIGISHGKLKNGSTIVFIILAN